MNHRTRVASAVVICVIVAGCSSNTGSSGSTTSSSGSTNSTSSSSSTSSPVPSSPAGSGVPASVASGTPTTAGTLATSGSVDSASALTTATSVGISVPPSSGRSAPASPTATPTVLHPVTVPASVIKSKTGGVQVLTLATVRGQQYAFVVDTGASVTVLDANLVKKLGLPAAGAATTAGQVGCTASAQPVALDDWSVGGQKLPAAVVLASAVNFSGQTFQGHQVAGLLGNEVFKAFGSLQIDYAGDAISLGATAAAGKPSFPVVVAGRNGTAELLATATLHGRGAGMLVDTGASHTLVDAAVAAKLGLAKVGPGTRIAGVSCSSPAQPVTIDDLSVGSITLPTVTGISAGSSSDNADAAVIGLIGSDVLSTFGTVTFDYTNRSVTLGG